VTLVLVAQAFLVVAAVTEQAHDPAPPGLARLTCNEVQHLFAALVAAPVADPRHWLRWSWWRRRRQARARTCHYHRQANGP
jgi:hypothetical protein